MNAVLPYVFLIPVLPLLGFIINGLGRNHLSKTMSGIIGSGVILGACIISSIIFAQQVSGSDALHIHYFNFLKTDALSIHFDFKIDALSSLFLMIITGIGFLIHVYSTAYMHDESAPDFAKYFAYLNLFVFSMLLLVMGAN